MKRLVIHAGFHKTGTTALQAAFWSARDQLSEVGIYYPKGPKGHAHHYLAKSPSNSSRNEALKAIRAMFNKVDSVVLASEFFSEFSENSVKNLAEEFNDVDLQVVFSIRPLYQMVPSQYQQLVRVGLDQSYQDFVASLLRESEQTKPAKQFWNRHDQSGIIQKWATHIGPKNVHVVSVDPVKPDFLFTWFESFLGLPKETLLNHSKVNLNRSLDAEELEFVRALRNALGEKRVEAEWIKIYRDRLIKEIVSRDSPNHNQIKLTMEPVQLKNLMGLSKAQQKAISGLGVQIHGTLTVDAPGAKGNTDKSTKIQSKLEGLDKVHIETLVAGLAAIRPKDSIKVVDTRDLVIELLKRAGVYQLLRRLKK